MTGIDLLRTAEIKKIPLFQGFNDTDYSQIADVADVVLFEPKNSCWSKVPSVANYGYCLPVPARFRGESIRITVIPSGLCLPALSL